MRHHRNRLRLGDPGFVGYRLNAFSCWCSLRARIDIYEYEIGNEPSAGRAVAHGFADVLTLGLWEIAGTPIEAVQGETYEATVMHDEPDRVAAIKTRKTGS
jgi:hypothetical protein